jgi:tetratricopeptide (TPR) repeat protein
MIDGMLKRQGYYEKALEHYKKAHALINDDLYWLVNLGAMLVLLKNSGDAEKYYAMVVELCEDKIKNGVADYWTYLYKGKALVALGENLFYLDGYKDALISQSPVEDVRSASDQLEIFCNLEFQINSSNTALNQVLYPYLSNTLN